MTTPRWVGVVRNPLTDRKRRRGQLPRAENQRGPTDWSGHVVGGAGGNRTPYGFVWAVPVSSRSPKFAGFSGTRRSD